MFRIDDTTYIDTSLITCAEYQLFIDELRGQGKNFQPDQWISYHFPKGQAQRPVLGVRPSDATSFCEWLTRREGNDWAFRLPTEKEANLNPIQHRDLLASAYWVVSPLNSRIILWIPRNIEEQFPLNVDEDQRFDLTLAQHLEHAFTRERNLVHERNRIRSIVFNRSMISERDRNLQLTLDHDREIVYKLTSNGEISKALEHALTLDTLDHGFFDAFDFVRKTSLDHINELVTTITVTLDRARASVNLNHRRITNDLERSHTLVRRRTESLVRDPDRANKLILELDKRHAQNLDHAHSIAIEREYQLAAAIENAKMLEAIGGHIEEKRINIAYELTLALDHARLQAIAHTQNDPNKHEYNRDFEPALNRTRALSRDLYRCLLVPNLLDRIQNMLILKLRRMDKYSAFEGIRIVKERKQE